MEDVTVILNGYKRPQNLDMQLEAVQNQSVKPKDIMLWYNHPGNTVEVNYDIVDKIPTALNNVNHGVWARFAFALLAKTKYVCIFDDDTIPGQRWLENCLETSKTHRGLLGTIGLLYTLPLSPNHPADSYFRHYIRFGWAHNNRNTEPVDLVGHSWFFEREWLSEYWRELPDPKFNTCGEDMHFSYILQKYLNLGTFVPPHPPEDKSLWGSIKGSELGGVNSLWTQGPTNQRELMDEFFKAQRQKGWKLLKDA